MKWILLFCLLATTGRSQVIPPPSDEIGYDLALEFTGSWLADGYVLYTNGSRAWPVDLVFYITNAPTGTTVYTVTATNGWGESLPSNALTNTVPPALTNWSVTIQGVLKITNDLVSPMKFYALCESTNLRTWQPAPGALNTITRTNW